MFKPSIQAWITGEERKDAQAINCDLGVVLLAQVIWWNEVIAFKIEKIPGDKDVYPVAMVTVKEVRTHQCNLPWVNQVLGFPSGSRLTKDFIMPSMNIITWNCRGAGNESFRTHFKDLVKMYRPQVVALMETKVTMDQMGLFFKNLGFLSSIIVDPIGRSGGIWVIWDPTTVTIFPMRLSEQVVKVHIIRDNYENWIFSAVYGSPNAARRKDLWDNIRDDDDNNNKAWLVAGDFNEIATADECFSASPDRGARQRLRFTNEVCFFNLNDLK